MPASPESALFRGLLGSRWEALPSRVRLLHKEGALVVARGRTDVRGGHRRLPCALRACLNMPAPVADAPLEVEIRRKGQEETWTRRFPDALLQSRLKPSSRWPDAFEEQLGAARITFTFAIKDGQLRWVTREVRLLALRLPLRWFHGIDARCSEREGRYRFDISVRLPFVGLLVAYAGWLEIVDAD